MICDIPRSGDRRVTIIFWNCNSSYVLCHSKVTHSQTYYLFDRGFIDVCTILHSHVSFTRVACLIHVHVTSRPYETTHTNATTQPHKRTRTHTRTRTRTRTCTHTLPLTHTHAHKIHRDFQGEYNKTIFRWNNSNDPLVEYERVYNLWMRQITHRQRDSVSCLWVRHGPLWDMDRTPRQGIMYLMYLCVTDLSLIQTKKASCIFDNATCIFVRQTSSQYR